jgi:hypothetical protein
LAEAQMRNAMSIGEGKWSVFVERPMSSFSPGNLPPHEVRTPGQLLPCSQPAGTCGHLAACPRWAWTGQKYSRRIFRRSHRPWRTVPVRSCRGSNLAAADLVICQTGCISHDDYWRVQDHCRRTGKPCILVDQAALPSAAQGTGQPVVVLRLAGWWAFSAAPRHAACSAGLIAKTASWRFCNKRWQLFF